MRTRPLLSHRIEIRLTEELHNELQRLAYEEDVSVSQLIRRLLRETLKPRFFVSSPEEIAKTIEMGESLRVAQVDR